MSLLSPVYRLSFLLALYATGGAQAQGLPSPHAQRAAVPSDQAPAAPPAVEPVLPGPRAPVPGPLRLDELEQLALGNHPRIQRAAAAVQMAQGRTWQARLYPNPQVATASPQLAGNNSQYNVYLSQTLVTAGKLRLDAAAASREIVEAQWDLVGARYDVLTGVRDAFYAVMVAQERVAVLDWLGARATKYHSDVERLFREAGRGTKADVLLFAIERDRIELQGAAARATWEAARRELAAAVGIPQLTIDAVRGDLRAPLPQFDLSALQEVVMANHSRARAARTQVERNGLRLARAMAEPVPDIEFQGGYQRQVEPAQDQGLFQVALDVPLWDRNQGAIYAARAGVSEARAEARRLELDLAQQTADAWRAYESARRQVEFYENGLLKTVRETLAIEERLRPEAENIELLMVSNLRVLTALRTASETEMAALDARAALWRAAARIGWLAQWDAFPCVVGAGP